MDYKMMVSKWKYPTWQSHPSHQQSPAMGVSKAQGSPWSSEVKVQRSGTGQTGAPCPRGGLGGDTLLCP